MDSKFSFRSEEKELMDAPDLKAMDLHKNLEELIFINRFTGGTAVTFEGLKKLLYQKRGKIHIADIGCGGGDMLDLIFRKAALFDVEIELTGIDFQPEAIAFAKKKYPRMTGSVNWIMADYRQLLEDGFKADIFLCSLFCHHLNDEEMKTLLSLLKKSAKTGFVVNDLQRSSLAYYSIKWLTKLFSRSKFTRNDAPVSVLRGFRKKELSNLLEQAGIVNYQITRKWAFRYLVVGRIGD